MITGTLINLLLTGSGSGGLITEECASSIMEPIKHSDVGKKDKDDDKQENNEEKE